MSHVVFFDGVCNLCNWSVDFIIKRDPKGVFKFASLQSDVAQRLLKQQQAVVDNGMRTIVLLKNDRLYYRSDAVLEICRDLSNPWPLLSTFKVIPRFIRDAVYRLISRNRYRWFGQKDTCRVPTVEEQLRFLETSDQAV